MNKLPILEIFGPTIQGEGSLIGMKTIFIRLAGCDYRCSWCDSAFTWDGSQVPTLMGEEEIVNYIREHIGMHNFAYVTISGGNPALWQLSELILLLQNDFKKKICLETQGSKIQPWFSLLDQLTISPKPPSSGEQTNWQVLDEILWKYKKQAILKVVVFDKVDYKYAQKIKQRYPNIQLFLQVGNSQLTETMDYKRLTLLLLQQLEWLTELVVNDAKMNNVRVLPQLHTLMWGNKRGV